MTLRPFAMERWQSTYENRVAHNLSESGVHALALGELLALADASVDRLRLGYGQSNGSDALRAAIAGLYPGADEGAVVVCNGSAEANFAALWTLVQPDDAVAIVVPTYMQTPGLAHGFGARVIELPAHEELGWQPDPDQVRRLLTGRVRLLVITNPGNPTGARLGDEALAALLEGAERTGAWILADEVYAGAELDGRITPTLFGRHPRVIATSSLSKAYGLAGLRLGWAVTTPELAGDLWARTDYTTIAPGTLSDRLATLALGGAVRPKLLERSRALIREGLAVVEPFLERWGCHWRRPDAGAICFARYPWNIDSGALAERLRVEQSVLVVSGEHFALERYLRLGIGIPASALQAALEAMDALVRTLPHASAGAPVGTRPHASSGAPVSNQPHPSSGAPVSTQPHASAGASDDAPPDAPPAAAVIRP